MDEEEQMINECMNEIDEQSIDDRRKMIEREKRWEHEIFYE